MCDDRIIHASYQFFKVIVPLFYYCILLICHSAVALSMHSTPAVVINHGVRM
jgi:hypothetical protein